MNANFPAGVSVKDLETDLHCALPDESEEQARREDEAYEKAEQLKDSNET